MSNHYLRIEGVNLGSFVFDTRDLSTTRGGSLLLLRAIKYVEACLPKITSVSNAKPVSIGASVGLFEIETDKPNVVIAELSDTLRAHSQFGEATFVIDTVPAGDFRENLEHLLAQNRWQQMQSSSLAIPQAQTNTAVPEQPACGLDGLRPAVKGINGTHRVRGFHVSDCVWKRREFGRSQRQSFYQSLTGVPELKDKEFSDEFDHIASGTSELDSKMAVFYADGNSFGKLQTNLCGSPAKQALWDHLIRTKRAEFLTSFIRDEVLDGTTVRAQWWNSEKGCIRFETLLWGGDELMFVMPAALGWRFAKFFFEKLENVQVKSATLPDDNPWFADSPSFSGANDILTHTAALVFCHHHAPIHRIKALAKEHMADFAKGKSRSHDQLLVLALESFDHMGTSYESGIKQRYHDKLSAAEIVIHSDASRKLSEVLETISAKVDKLKSSNSKFARSQLRWLVSTYLQSDSADRALVKWENAFAEGPGPFRKASAADHTALEALHKVISDDAALWIQLEELWDYARP